MISFIMSFTTKRRSIIKTNRYENRPSREEDVKRIRQLEADAIESRNVAARAREEMAFFKRELLNREENYNKKFNANPVVGVMQVQTVVLLFTPSGRRLIVADSFDWENDGRKSGDSIAWTTVIAPSRGLHMLLESGHRRLPLCTPAGFGSLSKHAVRLIHFA